MVIDGIISDFSKKKLYLNTICSYLAVLNSGPV